MEHNELFMVPGTPRYAPPYESLIREGRMGGKATSQARDIFSSAGFDIKTLDAEPHLSTKKHHDHLGFGLAFTSAMLWRSMLRPSEAVFCMRTACEFFEQRIAPWAPEYGRRLAGLALTKHFADLGQFTAGLDKLVPELCRDRKHHKSFSREPVPA
jgi:TorA maturation chaperone TorD